MQKFNFIDPRDINPLQIEIMQFVGIWTRTAKEPISQKEIVASMERQNKKSFTVINALTGLLRKGYLRKAYVDPDRKTMCKTFYVQVRSVS